MEATLRNAVRDDAAAPEGDAVLSATTYALFASALCSVPTAEVQERMAQLLEAAGDEAAARALELSDQDLDQRFYDRMVIAVSPLYLPAVESCIVDARLTDEGLLEPGHLDGRPMTEARSCYRQYSYDPASLHGFAPLIDSMRPDHLVAELGFMAHVRLVQSEGGPRGAAAGEFADRFLACHLLRWVPTLHEMAQQRGKEDVYVQLVGALCRWLAIDAGCPDDR